MLFINNKDNIKLPLIKFPKINIAISIRSIINQILINNNTPITPFSHNHYIFIKAFNNNIYYSNSSFNSGLISYLCNIININNTLQIELEIRSS